MPLYDFRCKCGALETLLLDYTDYDKLETLKCSKCGETLTKGNREIDANIKARVRGVSKGGYGSGDYT